MCAIVLRHSTSAVNEIEMRVCWNWQTGTFEGRVLHDVRVQVPSLAPVLRSQKARKSGISEIFLLSEKGIFGDFGAYLVFAVRYYARQSADWWDLQLFSYSLQIRFFTLVYKLGNIISIDIYDIIVYNINMFI